MIKILGVGWIKNGKYGLRKKCLTKQYNDLRSLYLKLKEAKIFKYTVENFARFDQTSKLASIVTALAFYDAGIIYARGGKKDIGIVAANKDGSLAAQVAYFKDYIDNGRILGRGNLFIYTLPSSPLAEVAIHFGLSGPISYLSFPDDSENIGLVEYAKDIVRFQDVKVMAVLEFTAKAATCSIIGTT